MRIYLAGASKEVGLVESFMRLLRDEGHVVTHDWCAEVRRNQELGVADWEITHDHRRVYASADLHGVSSADIVWLLAPSPDNHSTGCWTELGYALCLGKTIVASGAWKRCIFADLVEHRFDAHGHALQWILGRKA